MPLNFKAQLGEAVDQNTGLSIRSPRMLPASPPANPDDTEYQYTFYMNDESYYGLGIFGTDTKVEKDGHRRWTSTLNLGRDRLLDSVFRLKHDLGDHGDDFTFLKDLAHGLVTVFEKDQSDDDVHYVVVTNVALLTARGIVVPDNVVRLESDQIVLAETFVSAKTGS